MPAPPIPATALPKISIKLLLAIPHSRLPSSKTEIAVKNTHLMLKKV
jgi:hypothetical protein